VTAGLDLFRISREYLPYPEVESGTLTHSKESFIREVLSIKEKEGGY